jgi:hypothetical protein
MELTTFGSLRVGDRFRFALTNAKPGRWVWAKRAEFADPQGDICNYQRTDDDSAYGFASGDARVWHPPHEV